MIWWALVAAPWLLSFVAGRSALRLARRATPEPALRVLIGSGVFLATASTVSIGLVAVEGVGRFSPIASVAHWTGAVPRWAVVPPAWCTVAALIALALLVRRVVGRATGIAATTARAASVQREAPAPIVAIHDADAYAYACRAIPYKPGVVFISDGLRDALDADELASVIAHERAHIDRQHALYQHACAVIAAVNPFLAPLGRAVDYCLERVADERAAATTDRATTAAALARAALARTVARPVIGLAHARTDVAWRVEALLEDPARRATRVFAVAALAIVAVVAVAFAAHDTDRLFDAIQR